MTYQVSCGHFSSDDCLESHVPMNKEISQQAMDHNLFPYGFQQNDEIDIPQTLRKCYLMKVHHPAYLICYVHVFPATTDGMNEASFLCPTFIWM